MSTPKVLIFSATNGYRHESIPAAVASLQRAGPAQNIFFIDTEDSTQFNDENLSQFDAILFLMNCDKSPEDPILDSAQQQALQNFLNAGGNFIGVHAGNACLYGTSFFERAAGALFDFHPEIGVATFLNNIEPDHSTVSMIPQRWTFTEEVYNFKSDPRSVGAKVVLTVDQPDGDPCATIHGSPHPITWYQERVAGVDPAFVHTAGRSFYTSLGHLSSTWEDPIFMAHVMAGIKWAVSGTGGGANP